MQPIRNAPALSLVADLVYNQKMSFYFWCQRGQVSHAFYDTTEEGI
jgi:hypothetical protein